MRFLCLLLLALTSLAVRPQSVPPSGANDPRKASALSIYDWTAPLNWPNDATLFLRGDRTWAVVSGGGGTVTPNTTVPSLPFLSALNTYTDSPLFRKDANTVEQRNGATSQCFVVYANYTDAANNAGFSICPGNIVSILQTFKNGTSAIGALQLNVTTGNTGILQVAGVNVLRWGSTGVSLFQPILNIGTAADGTSGQYGVPAVLGTFALDGHNDATRNDISCPGTVSERQVYVVGTFTVNAVQAGATATTTLNWTDGGNSVAKTFTFPNLDISNSANQIDIFKPIRVKGGTTVTFTTTTAAIGAGSYNARVACVSTF